MKRDEGTKGRGKNGRKEVRREGKGKARGKRRERKEEREKGSEGEVNKLEATTNIHIYSVCGNFCDNFYYCYFFLAGFILSLFTNISSRG